MARWLLQATCRMLLAAATSRAIQLFCDTMCSFHILLIYCLKGQLLPWRRSCTPLHAHTCCNMLSGTPLHASQRMPYHTSLPLLTASVGDRLKVYSKPILVRSVPAPRHRSVHARSTPDTRSCLYLHYVTNRHGESRGAAGSLGRRSGPRVQGCFLVLLLKIVRAISKALNQLWARRKNRDPPDKLKEKSKCRPKTTWHCVG